MKDKILFITFSIEYADNSRTIDYDLHKGTIVEWLIKNCGLDWRLLNSIEVTKEEASELVDEYGLRIWQ